CARREGLWPPYAMDYW
nr:immunoglobulin heavy chain junction region [Mus musculus]